MRLLFGIILGIGLTLGAAFLHDNNVPTNPPSLRPSQQQIVNWDVLGAVMREQTRAVQRLWQDLVGR